MSTKQTPLISVHKRTHLPHSTKSIWLVQVEYPYNEGAFFVLTDYEFGREYIKLEDVVAQWSTWQGDEYNKMDLYHFAEEYFDYYVEKLTKETK